MQQCFFFNMIARKMVSVESADDWPFVPHCFHISK